ncbi:hypothetical protein C8R44DRAFT_740848 [Mycena epipterygia]|nr:hypothetical protein C8R44DRAFT_740848 [Mycena epipterygia]
MDDGGAKVAETQLHQNGIAWEGEKNVIQCLNIGRLKVFAMRNDKDVVEVVNDRKMGCIVHVQCHGKLFPSPTPGQGVDANSIQARRGVRRMKWNKPSLLRYSAKSRGRYGTFVQSLQNIQQRTRQSTSAEPDGTSERISEGRAKQTGVPIPPMWRRWGIYENRNMIDGSSKAPADIPTGTGMGKSGPKGGISAGVKTAGAQRVEGVRIQDRAPRIGITVRGERRVYGYEVGRQKEVRKG